MYMDRDVAENVYGRYIAETLGEYVRPLAGNEDNWRGSKLTALIQDGDYDRAAAALAKRLSCAETWKNRYGAGASG